MKKLFFLLRLCFISFWINAQTSDTLHTVPQKLSYIDTNYVKTYRNKLVVGLWQSERSFNIQLDQTKTSTFGKSSINYIANANHVSGIALDYDILSLSFGYRSIPAGNSRTGNTNYTAWGFNINTNGLRVENSYRRYTGFYDNNSGNYIHPFTESTPYFQNPSLRLRLIKSKLIYAFGKKKFALGAAYSNTKRQVKSHGSWLVTGNFYSLKVTSANSMIPQQLQSYYKPDWNGLDYIKVNAYSLGFGCSYTLVFFKVFYFNFLASLGIEDQYGNLSSMPYNTKIKYHKVRGTIDWRTAVGYNGRRFFIRLTNIIDSNNYSNDILKIDMQFIATSFDFGYRFNFKPPKPYKKIQETKIYKML